MDNSNPEALITAALNWRYAVKKFDPERRITAAHWDVLQQSLVLAPSSYGLQPWKFIVVSSDEKKNQLPEACWGQRQPADCSHFVVIAARRKADPDFVKHFIRSIAETRGLAEASLQSTADAILGKLQRMGDDHLPWTARQCYIPLGFLLQSAALLQIDACPMEGIMPDRIDPLLGLQDTEWTSVVACALGYRAADDPAAQQARVRFPASETVVHL
ncbi:MAG: NAD(P)H-dependent oxidoreductase [Planctomycetaceae bacterium]